jgi:signal peptide peptidase SppA
MAGTTTNPTTETKRRGVDVRLASRVFDTPHLIQPEKGRVIISALSERLGVKPLIDGVFFWDEDEEKDRAVYDVVDGVAIIDVSGTLVAKAGAMDAMSGLTSYQALGQHLERALADRSVDAILFDIDSPGGECAGCFELADKIHAARQKKPIYAVANPLAASGAYAIAAAASKVFAPAVSYVGSIGVYTVHVDQSKYDAERGVAYEYTYAGARKIDGNPHAPMTDEARKATQERIDSLYGIFVASVAHNRGMTEDAVRATEAGVLLGEQALAAGLIDTVGGRDEALAELKAAVQETRQMKQLEIQIATLTTERDAARAEVETLKGKVAAFEKIEAQREKDDDAAYVEQLKARSAELGAPLGAEELAAVESQFAAGNRAAAKAIGDAYLKLAQSRGTKVASKKLEPETVPGAKSAALAEAELLERRGWKVRLNDAKTEILETIPPEKKGS